MKQTTIQSMKDNKNTDGRCVYLASTFRLASTLTMELHVPANNMQYQMRYPVVVGDA